MIKSKRLFTAMLCCVGLLAAATVQAGVSSYAGTHCVRAVNTSAQPWYMGATAEALNGGDFECPAVQQGGQLVNAVVHGYDRSPLSEVRCKAVVRDKFGGSAIVTATVGSGPAFTGKYTLNLGGWPPRVFLPTAPRSSNARWGPQSLAAATTSPRTPSKSSDP